MDLATSLQRLSSGLRINSAKDDAAGLAISERMSTQIRGMNVAMRNANDGVSLAQTAEGSLDSVSNALQRIRELAVQSANATNSASDRAALDAEAQQLKSEINRVATQTNFNGVKLLDGSFTNKTFQVGANNGETISVSNIVNAKSDTLGVTDIATVDVGAVATAPAATAITAGDIKITAASGAVINVGAFTTGATADTAASSVLQAINAVSDQTGVFATITDGTTDQLTFTASHAIVVAASGTATAAVTGLGASTTGAVTTVTGFDTLDITSGRWCKHSDSVYGFSIKCGEYSSRRFRLRFKHVLKVWYQIYRLTSRIPVLHVVEFVMLIFAAETANLTRNQILQQAGTAMLAQANQIPQNVLSLLR